MSSHNDPTIDRRGVLKTSAAMLGGALVGTMPKPIQSRSFGM